MQSISVTDLNVSGSWITSPKKKVGVKFILIYSLFVLVFSIF